jgi:hypothetical protein
MRFSFKALVVVFTAMVLPLSVQAQGRPVKEVLPTVLGDGGTIVIKDEGREVKIPVIVPVEQKAGVVMDALVYLQSSATDDMFGCQAFVVGEGNRALLIRIINQTIRVGEMDVQEIAIYPSGNVFIAPAGSEDFKVAGRYVKTGSK